MRLQHGAVALQGDALSAATLGENPIAARLFQASTDRRFLPGCAGAGRRALAAGSCLLAAGIRWLLLSLVGLRAGRTGCAATGTLTASTATA